MRVLKAGILTTIQDLGRFGYSHLGITQSGVMDIYSYKWLNKLLNNERNTNCLEILLGNIELEATKSTFMVTTGAKCEFFINEQQKENWKVYKINSGDRIRIGKITGGIRSYLGVKGGFVLDKELGSCSTTLKENIGREKLKDNEILEYTESHTLPLKTLQKRFIPKYSEEITLRVVLGYQQHSFSKEEKEKFFSTTYTVSNEFNRMGCKLSGEKIESSLNGIVSEAISLGSIQIPKDGQPIILMQERQTIGGYPKIGSVIPIDCYRLSQLRAGCRVKFQEISLGEAIEKQKRFEESFYAI